MQFKMVRLERAFDMSPICSVKCIKDRLIITGHIFHGKVKLFQHHTIKGSFGRAPLFSAGYVVRCRVYRTRLLQRPFDQRGQVNFHVVQQLAVVPQNSVMAHSHF